MTEKRDYKELAKSNQFLANAKEIRLLCIEMQKDVGVATDQFVANHKLDFNATIEEKNFFLELCREKPLKEIVKEL